jgi:hypothetical protein
LANWPIQLILRRVFTENSSVLAFGQLSAYMHMLGILSGFDAYAYRLLEFIVAQFSTEAISTVDFVTSSCIVTEERAEIRQQYGCEDAEPKDGRLAGVATQRKREV